MYIDLINNENAWTVFLRTFGAVMSRRNNNSLYCLYRNGFFSFRVPFYLIISINETYIHAYLFKKKNLFYNLRHLFVVKSYSITYDIFFLPMFKYSKIKIKKYLKNYICSRSKGVLSISYMYLLSTHPVSDRSSMLVHICQSGLRLLFLV